MAAFVRPPSIATEDRGMAAGSVSGRLVLDDRLMPGRVEILADRIVAVTADDRAVDRGYVAAGYVDVHVHGWNGYSAMDGARGLDGMSASLLQHGVTSFLPTAETASIENLVEFAENVRRWSPMPPGDRSEPLGFNLEGPFISRDRLGAQNGAFIQVPAAMSRAVLEPLLDGLRVMTMAPELDGAPDLIRWLANSGVVVSLGHSNASADQADAAYDAGATSTTHLFNAMSGVDHHAPGLAVTALTNDAAYVELVADGLHVDRRLWSLILRSKPANRLVLVSDAIELAGLGDSQANVAGMHIQVRDGRCVLASDGRLAGSVIALDSAVRNLVASGVPLHVAVRAASRSPLELLGITDRGTIAVGQLADLVELDDALRVRRVMKRGRWLPAAEALGDPAHSQGPGSF